MTDADAPDTEELTSVLWLLVAADQGSVMKLAKFTAALEKSAAAEATGPVVDAAEIVSSTPKSTPRTFIPLRLIRIGPGFAEV